MNTAQPRKLSTIRNAVPSQDGDGVRIRRVALQREQAIADPFLMVDEIASDEAADYIGGFPEHPHRGFETVTLMLDGRMRHRDHLGNEGVIEPGGVQWMSAGSGVLHAEMPEQNSGRLHGFQLWINLPAAEKMQPARYREFDGEAIALRTDPGGGSARVIAGQIGEVSGPISGVATRPLIADITLPPGATFSAPVSPTATTLLYVYEGEAELPAAGGTHPVSAGQLARLEGGDRIDLQGKDQTTRLLLLAAEPIGEPVAHYGPFVMNTADEIEQAIADYRDGTLVS